MRLPLSFRGAVWILPVLLLALVSTSASAAVDNAGILDNVLTRYSAASNAWATTITARASWLFWTLVVISMVWTFGMMALRKGDIGEFYAEFVRFTIFTGFYWWLLVNGPAFAGSIIDSLRQVSAEATGLPNALAPSGIVDIGFDIFFRVLDQSSVWSPVDSGCGIIIAAVILIVFALVGVNMLLLLISGWILAYAGVFFLGFGGSRWTSDMAIGYFKTVLNIAAQLFTMVLLIGIGKSFVDQYYAAMSAGMSLKELGVMLVVSAIMLALVKTIPGLIGGLAGGNVGALGSGFGAGAALGAAAVGAAGIGVAGAAVVAGTASMAGGAHALMTAFSKAVAAESIGGVASAGAGATESSESGGEQESGTSEFAAAMGEPGSTSAMEAASAAPASAYFGASAFGDAPNGGVDSGVNAGSSGAGSAGEGGAPGEVKSGSALAAVGAVASKAGRVAARTATNLAQGTWDTAKSKAIDVKDSVIDRMGETTGGKIAAAIKARQIAEATGDGEVQFAQNSLGSGAGPVDAQAEVAAFRDRGKRNRDVRGESG